jgi:hypothetical protein
MLHTLHRRDHDNGESFEASANVAGWGDTFMICYHAPLVTMGAADLNEPTFATGPLVLTDGVLARHATADGTPDLTAIRPYIERFFAREWNTPDGESETGHVNDLLTGGETGTFIWDAFTHEGVRYNIVCYLGLETTVMLASEY